MLVLKLELFLGRLTPFYSMRGGVGSASRDGQNTRPTTLHTHTPPRWRSRGGRLAAANRPPPPVMPIHRAVFRPRHFRHLAWSIAVAFLERSAFIRAASPRQAHRQRATQDPLEVRACSAARRSPRTSALVAREPFALRAGRRRRRRRKKRKPENENLKEKKSWGPRNSPTNPVLSPPPRPSRPIPCHPSRARSLSCVSCIFQNLKIFDDRAGEDTTRKGEDE